MNRFQLKIQSKTTMSNMFENPGRSYLQRWYNMSTYGTKFKSDVEKLEEI